PQSDGPDAISSAAIRDLRRRPQVAPRRNGQSGPRPRPKPLGGRRAGRQPIALHVLVTVGASDAALPLLRCEALADLLLLGRRGRFAAEFDALGLGLQPRVAARRSRAAPAVALI